MQTRYYYCEHTGVELVITEKAHPGYPEHMHLNHWTGIHLLAGELAVFHGQQAVKLKPGSQVVLPPAHVHSLKASPDCKFITLCLNNEAPSQNNKAFCNWLASLHLNGLQNQIKALYERLVVQKSSYNAKNGQTAPREQPVQAVREVIRAIKKDPANTLPLEKVATHAGYSRWHFMRMFRAATGLTPHAYQANCRISMLRKLLRQNMALSEAANNAGFFDQSHMSRVFKHYHLLTPAAFLKASVNVRE